MRFRLPWIVDEKGYDFTLNMCLKDVDIFTSLEYRPMAKVKEINVCLDINIVDCHRFFLSPFRVRFLDKFKAFFPTCVEPDSGLGVEYNRFEGHYSVSLRSRTVLPSLVGGLVCWIFC